MNRPAPKFAYVGKRARFSYVTRDAKTGVTVRRWHDAMASQVSDATAKALRGMVSP